MTYDALFIQTEQLQHILKALASPGGRPSAEAIASAVRSVVSELENSRRRAEEGVKAIEQVIHQHGGVQSAAKGAGKTGARGRQRAGDARNGTASGDAWTTILEYGDRRLPGPAEVESWLREAEASGAQRPVLRSAQMLASLRVSSRVHRFLPGSERSRQQVEGWRTAEQWQLESEQRTGRSLLNQLLGALIPVPLVGPGPVMDEEIEVPTLTIPPMRESRGYWACSFDARVGCELEALGIQGALASGRPGEILVEKALARARLERLKPTVERIKARLLEEIARHRKAPDITGAMTGLG